jgi:phospholipase C
MDHIVVVLFENRSLDNVLGHLYGPEDGKTFEGVIGKNLTNPIPEWAEHGSERKVVPYTVATNMDSPNPDSGEEYPHTNTQLYNILSEKNRFKLGKEITAPWNAPEPGQTPTMDGYVTDYISAFTAEMGRQPTYEEYSQIMTGFTPEQVPVLNGLARAFGVFDHWFCEVPSQTFMNRSFWTAATSSGLVVNDPAKKWVTRFARQPSVGLGRPSTKNGAGQRLGTGDLDAVVIAEVPGSRIVSPDVLNVLKPVLTQFGVHLLTCEEGHERFPEPGGNRAHP